MQTVPLQHIGPVCVKFYYHMYGEDMGSVQLSTDDQDDYAFWARAGEQGNSWKLAEVTVDLKQKTEGVCSND